MPAQDKHNARPIIYPAHAAILFRRTKEAFDTFNRTLRAESLEWDNYSKPYKEKIRNRYCAKYADFNAYRAMQYLISLLKGNIISAECETALVNTIMREHQEAVYEKRLSRKPVYKKVVSIQPVENRPDKQDDDDDRITSLLNVYLALNKQQLNSLRECSLEQFASIKMVNDTFLSFLKLHNSWNELIDLSHEAGQNSRDLDRQLWSDISALDYQLERNSDITHIESRMYKWTYADMLVHGQKILPDDIAIYKLDLTDLPKSKQFIVTIDNSFNSEQNYDYQDVYTKFR